MLGSSRARAVGLFGALFLVAPSLASAQLVAFEVIWSPAADADRMSSLELETLYPELRAVRHDVGRVRCVCGVPYAAELASCPSCGRPVAEALRVG